MASSFKDILFEIKDYVCTITIDRPQALNAFSLETLSELEEAVLSTYENGKIGVVVLTGAGDRSFSAGRDVKSAATEAQESLEWRLGRLIFECPKPVIARVNGYAIGGGNHIAYSCDFTIAAEHARFGQTEARVGAPGCGYPVSHAVNIVGHKRAREMWMLNRQYSAQQMLDWGMVNAVVPFDRLDEEVSRWCETLLAMSPTCVKILKHSFRLQMEPILRDSMRDIIARVAPGFERSEEREEGARAYREKRRPNFDPWR